MEDRELVAQLAATLYAAGTVTTRYGNGIGLAATVSRSACWSVKKCVKIAKQILAEVEGAEPSAHSGAGGE